MKNTIIILFLLSTAFCQHQFSGFVNFSSANRLNDASLIRLPYRISGISWDYSAEQFSLSGDFAMEYYVRDDLDFINDRSIQEFSLDLRELYFQFYSGNTEFRFGKQIHSWGMVDENSPLDIANAYDYYYLFNAGTERKLGSWSFSSETYFYDLVIKMLFSPFHQTNRLPVISGSPDPEFGFDLPVAPQENQFIEIENTAEYGLSIQKTVMNTDVSLMMFSGYDRLFNLSGVNVFGMGEDISFPKIDIVYGHRQTGMVGLGLTHFINGITLRTDFGYFNTEDQNADIRKEKTFVNQAYDQLHFSYPLQEKAEYFQVNIQIEYDLPFETGLIIQFFSYDTLEYSSKELPIEGEVDIPNLEIDPSELSPAKLFTPGMGAPFAALSKQGVFFNLTRNFLDNQLTLNAGGFLDISAETGLSGSMTTIGLEYEVVENLQFKAGLTKIMGSDDHPDGDRYRFNEMEDFSNIRLQLDFRF